MDALILERLVDSHDELRKVCQVAFATIMEDRQGKRIWKNLVANLNANDVPEGFADRADEIRREVMRDRIVYDA